MVAKREVCAICGGHPNSPPPSPRPWRPLAATQPAWPGTPHPSASRVRGRLHAYRLPGGHPWVLRQVDAKPPSLSSPPLPTAFRSGISSDQPARRVPGRSARRGAADMAAVNGSACLRPIWPLASSSHLAAAPLHPPLGRGDSEAVWLGRVAIMATLVMSAAYSPVFRLRVQQLVQRLGALYGVGLFSG